MCWRVSEGKREEEEGDTDDLEGDETNDAVSKASHGRWLTLLTPLAFFRLCMHAYTYSTLHALGSTQTRMPKRSCMSL